MFVTFFPMWWVTRSEGSFCALRDVARTLTLSRRQLRQQANATPHTAPRLPYMHLTHSHKKRNTSRRTFAATTDQTQPIREKAARFTAISTTLILRSRLTLTGPLISQLRHITPPRGSTIAHELITHDDKTMPPLPYELWLRILESLSHAHLLARPAYVNCFVKAIIRNRATEEDLVAELPEFESRAWRATRPYYAINSEIRKAAQHVFLSGVLLQTCRAPLEEVPRKRKGRRRARGMKADESVEASFWVPDVLARMRLMESEDGAEGLVPTYLPLEVFGCLFSAPQNHARKLKSVLVQHVLRVVGDDSVLRTVRKVELVAAAPEEELMGEAWECAEELKRRIEMVWEGMGVQGGT